MAEATTISPEELWEPYDVLIGGLGALAIREFTDAEKKKFDKFVEDSVDALNKISPEIAADFKDQSELFLSVGKVFKAKVDKAFGGILPTSGQFGVGLIIPQDIRYAATPSSTNPCYTDYPVNSWTLSLTAGTTVYFLGSSANFYKARTTTGYRCAMVIMKNGIIEVGTSPSVNQFQVQTERTSYPAFSVHPLVDQPIERGYTIYRYNLPFAVPVFHDFGVKLMGMPITTKSSEIRLIGVIFYEYDHRASLTYVTS